MSEEELEELQDDQVPVLELSLSVWGRHVEAKNHQKQNNQSLLTLDMSQWAISTPQYLGLQVCPLLLVHSSNGRIIHHA